MVRILVTWLIRTNCLLRWCSKTLFNVTSLMGEETSYLITVKRLTSEITQPSGHSSVILTYQTISSYHSKPKLRLQAKPTPYS